MADKTYGKKCSTCWLYQITKGECVGKEWKEIPQDATIGSDECEYYQKEQINTYGNRHLDYIKEYETVFYEDLLISDQLETHLIEVGKRAKETLMDLEDKEKKNNPCPYDFIDTSKVAAYNNNVRSRMEEIVLRSIVFNKGE